MRIRGLLAVAAIGVLSGCRDDEIACPGWVISPIAVEVRDATTQAPAAAGTTLTIRSGDYVASVFGGGPAEQLRLSADGGPGTYTVRVEKAGYHDWIRNGVYVRGGVCGVVREVLLRADIERSQ